MVPSVMEERTFVFVGSGKGFIHVFRAQRSSAGAGGGLSEVGAFPAGENPSYLAFHPRRPYLFAVDERTQGRVRSFLVNPKSGALTPQNEISSGGEGPAHLCVDRTGRVLLCANHGSGTVMAAPIHEDGSLGAPTFEDAAGDKAHQMSVDPSNRHVFVPCLGSDHLAQYTLDVAHARLERNAHSPWVPAPKGSGPRHLAFHPHAPFAFVLHELANTVAPHRLDAASGGLAPAGPALCALPPGFSGESTGAAVRVHPNGRFLFASCRGPDTVATFEVEASTGALRAVAHTPTGGAHPRSFALSEDGGRLLVANMQSDTLCAFAVDAATGALGSQGELAQVPEPAFVGFWRPPVQ